MTSTTHDAELEGRVQQTRSRRTGTIVVLVDAERSGDFNTDEGGRWVTFCVDHGQFVQHLERKTAASFLPYPDEFCQGCAALRATR